MGDRLVPRWHRPGTVLLRQAEHGEQAKVLEGDDPRDTGPRDRGHQDGVRVMSAFWFALVDRERQLPRLP
jgi:hypothetical protein